MASLPRRRDERCVNLTELAERARVRALLRLPRGRDKPVVPRDRLRQPPGRTTEVTGGGLSLLGGHHGQGDRVHPRRESDRPREALLPLLRPRCRARPAPFPERMGRPLLRQIRHGLRGAPRADPGAAEGTRPGSEDTELPPINPLGSTETRQGPMASCSLPWTKPAGGSLSDDEKRLFSCMAEAYAGSSPTPITRLGACSTTSTTSASARTRSSWSFDNGASGEGGPDGPLNETKFANGIPDDMADNLRQIDELGGVNTYNDYLNGWRWPSTPVQDVETLRVQRRHRRSCIILGLPGRTAGARSGRVTMRWTSCRRS